MSFNPDKCEVIRITKKRKPIVAHYTIHGKELGHTKNAKYLGVLINDNLSWNEHLDTVTKKANNTTAFLRRNLSSCPQHIKETCYKTFVRPQLEYAATVWDPHTDINIAKLEGVQRRAARFVTNDYNYTSSVTAMMRALEWESLQQRRQEAEADMMYRIVNSLVDIPPQHHLHQQGTALTRGRVPVQIHGPLQQDRHTQNGILPFCYSSVEPASREPCQRLFPLCLQDWDSGSSLHLDCECDAFNLFLKCKYGPSLTCPKLLSQCDDAYSLVMHFNGRRRRIK